MRFLGDTVTGQGSGGSSVYYADPDGVVRRADAGYDPPGSDGSADTTMGLPMAKMTGVGTGFAEPSTITPGLSKSYALGSNLNTQTVPTQNVCRPYILHRPFCSVAEMGYAFRGTPWKSINFSMPESGDSALLDLFTLTETTVRADSRPAKLISTRDSLMYSPPFSPMPVWTIPRRRPAAQPPRQFSATRRPWPSRMES